MEKFIWNKKSYAKENKDFISIKAYSGYSSSAADPNAEDYIIKPQTADEILGKAITESLMQSRHLSLEEDDAICENISQNYKSWIDRLMTSFGYKTKRAMFKDMKSCRIELQDGVIVIRPSHHERLEGWSGDNFTEADYVRVSVDAPPAEIGAALRLAFSRCTSKKF